jgi:hypothetical protein
MNFQHRFKLKPIEILSRFPCINQGKMSRMKLVKLVPGFVDRVLRFVIPAGLIATFSVFAAFALARSNRLSLTEQRTIATLVGLMLSLTVLVLVALPLTWRRALLVGSVAMAFVSLFPIPAVRSFYALQLPSEGLATTILIGIVGAALIIAMWVVIGHLGRDSTPPS